MNPRLAKSHGLWKTTTICLVFGISHGHPKSLGTNFHAIYFSYRVFLFMTGIDRHSWRCSLFFSMFEIPSDGRPCHGAFRVSREGSLPWAPPVPLFLCSERRWRAPGNPTSGPSVRLRHGTRGCIHGDAGNPSKKNNKNQPHQLFLGKTLRMHCQWYIVNMSNGR